MSADIASPIVPAATSSTPLLSVRGLTTSFRTDDGPLRAIDDISFDVPARGTLGIVGESGSGKSVTSLSILRLLPTPPARIEAGTIELEGRDLLKLSEREMQRVRGGEIAMVFQEPMTSLNPVYTVGAQIIEAIRLHEKTSHRQARTRAIELLQKVGIPAPKERIDSYPHAMSGGMRQRVMIAMALACNPKLLIADEPTTALDVTIQAQVLDLLRRLQDELGMSIIFITHDLGVVSEIAQRVVVMYAGRVVEEADVDALFSRPRHPYTRGLLAAMPPVGSSLKLGARAKRLPTIEGMLPDLRHLPSGCRFQDRCDLVIDRCRRQEPALRDVAVAGQPPRTSRCHRAEEL